MRGRHTRKNLVKKFTNSVDLTEALPARSDSKVPQKNKKKKEPSSKECKKWRSGVWAEGQRWAIHDESVPGGGELAMGRHKNVQTKKEPSSKRFDRREKKGLNEGSNGRQ